MRTPNSEQQTILNSSARIRVVRASPGSGKTWVVAELIRQELAIWNTATNGMAALSFTHVGGDEIRKAVGHDLLHPHYVGTIDAFLFRYVVRPFLRLGFPAFAAPRLVPGEWGAELWTQGRQRKAVVGQGKVNVFACVWIDEENGSAVAAHRNRSSASLERLTGNLLEEVKNAKKEIWRKSGQHTHSDAALWASRLLDHPEYGPHIRAEIVRRFPLIIVDELQDTGYFLGKSIRLLLTEAASRGVLVGDPDQAIFEFNGARPDLFRQFEELPDTETFPLTDSRRCGPLVVVAASHLKDSAGHIGAAPNATGRTVILRYDNMVSDVRRLFVALQNNRHATHVKIIARHGSTVDALAGRKVQSAPRLGCPTLNHLQRAVTLFRQQRQAAALAAVRAGLDVAVFGSEGIHEEELIERKIRPPEWRALAIRVLLRGNTLPTSGTYYDWQIKAGKIIDEELSAFDFDSSVQFATGPLRPKKIRGHDKLVINSLPSFRSLEEGQLPLPVFTVHGVKGETHDVTLFVCPPRTKTKQCPSTIWWSANERDREEKRIAYVAVTRTRGDLFLCVSNDCFERLSKDRKPFIAAFECFSVDQFIQTIDQREKQVLDPVRLGDQGQKKTIHRVKEDKTFEISMVTPGD